mmetsp:Transcript_4541/g.9871  ORF Transcript_4541/g.9871 Transcript_4541/m.9871 type:complete len:278 (-) Transcript_4541:261-1094(-)|eukprot:6180379-Pleurochrysis_carterae.AAC.2
MLGWLLVGAEWLLWGILMPCVALLAWSGARIILLCMPRHEALPVWMDTPWDLLLYMFICIHDVRMVDCEHAASGLVIPEAQNFSGAVLANHRSWADFIIDPYQAHCAVVARVAAVAVCLLSSIVGFACNRIIVIVRGKTSRQELMRKTSLHSRFIVYPEGTRRASAMDADSPSPLRVGGLKNLYESNTPALIVITVNKERIFNEKKGHVSFGTKLYRARHAPLCPSSFDNFEVFLEAVEHAWQTTWRLAHALRTADEAGRLSDVDADLVPLQQDVSY